MSRRVAVVGAGLAGVATAFELASLGCEVHVFERGGSVAERASFAGNALLSPMLADVPGFSLAELPAPLIWRWHRWRATKRVAAGSAALLALSRLGLARTAEWRRDLGIDDEATSGLLIALPDARRTDAAASQLDAWRGAGLQVELLEPGEARLREPGLSPDAPLAGALAILGAGAANPRLFAQQLRQQAQRRGANFRFHTTVRALDTDGGGMTLRYEYTPPPEAPSRQHAHSRLPGDTQPHPLGPQQARFDAVVLCNGLDAAGLARHRLRLATQHETCVTAPLRLVEAHPDLGPRAAWVDPGRGLAVTRIGQRVRVTGGLAVTGSRARLTPRYVDLHRGLQHWFPGSVMNQQVQQGVSRRALAADGLPVVGPGVRPGLWWLLATAGRGWAWTCGAAQALALQIAGMPGSVDLAPLSPERLT